MSEHEEVADGMHIHWDAPIEMDDGVVLRANVFRPNDDGTYPALLTYGPYGKDLPFAVGYPGFWRQIAADDPSFSEEGNPRYQAFEVPDPTQWVKHGYVIVRIDSRGAGRSPGVVDNFSTREVQDFYDCIEWAGTQPWCDGKVGTTGTSYFAVMQWLVAQKHPPHLAAMYVSEGLTDYYRDSGRHGGILNQFQRHWFSTQVQNVQNGLGERGYRNEFTGMLVSGDQEMSPEELRQNVGADPFVSQKARPLATDEYYLDRTAQVEEITTPFVSVGSWGAQGIHLRGNVEGFLRARSERKWLSVVAGSGYVYFHSKLGTAHQLSFFDYLLKGKGDFANEPRVRVQVRHVDGSFHDRTGDDWPLPATEWRDLHFDLSDSALDWETVSGPTSATYRGKTQGVTLKTKPLNGLELVGPLSCRLWVSSTTRDADLFVVLRLFAPDGAEVLLRGQPEVKAPLAQGWLRASHRKLDSDRSRDYRPFHSHDVEEPLVPGEKYQVDVEIWPTAILIPPGYQLALTIAGQDFDHGLEPIKLEFAGEPVYMRGSGHFTHADDDDRPDEVFDREVTVYSGGAEDSRLLIPVVSGQPES